MEIGTVKKDLQEIIDTNSKFIRHIKDNVVLIEKNIGDYEIYYTGQQGWSKKLYGWNEKNDKFHSGKKSAIFKERDSSGKEYNCEEKRVYVDFVEEIKSNSYTPPIPNKLEIRKLTENKLALLAIRFSKRFDNALIKNICQTNNFNPKAITKSENKKETLREVIEWVIKNTSRMINIDKNKEYAKYDDENNKESRGSFAVDVSELFLIINQPLMDEIRLKEIFKEIQLVNYFKNLIIIDAELPNNFEAILINKRAFWYYYNITNLFGFSDFDFSSNINGKDKNKIFLHIDYQLGIIPFVGACALVKK